jgi:cytochrome c-type biogenesis protein CcmE
MTPRGRRMSFVVAIVLAVGAATAFALTAFKQNIVYYYTPSEVADGKANDGRAVRIGGMVDKGSFTRTAGSMEVHFVITDFKHDVPAVYTGVLPDLFREGQGVIARGRIGSNGTLQAEEVLAKHDENYMPPKVAEEVRLQHEQRQAKPAT